MRRLLVSRTGQDRYASQATKAAMRPKAGSANGRGAPSPISIRTNTAAGITIRGSLDSVRSSRRLRSSSAVRGGALEGAEFGAD